MRNVFGILVAVFVVYVLIEVIRIVPLYRNSSSLVSAARVYERSGGTFRVLILGDSTGVGVGAGRPEDSIAGRIAAVFPDSLVENLAISGARIDDVARQAGAMKQSAYDLAVVQIGANDIIRFLPAVRAAAGLRPILDGLNKRAGRVVFLAAGNVGAAPFFPYLLRPWYHHQTRAYHREFARLATETQTVYVNLYAPPETDPFVKDPGFFLASDQLHPSSQGYALWFERLQFALKD
jgi:lysophospholipase L1-like esterase